jgi:hypothetical protein
MEQEAHLRVIESGGKPMLKPWILSGVAALAFGAVLALPQSASANWSGAAAANLANAEGLSEVVDVRWRGRGVHWRGGRGVHWRGGHWRGGGIWWGAPLIAAPLLWGAPYAFAAPQRCGWVWSPRRVRNVWRCW